MDVLYFLVFSLLVFSSAAEWSEEYDFEIPTGRQNRVIKPWSAADPGKRFAHKPPPTFDEPDFPLLPDEQDSLEEEKPKLEENEEFLRILNDGNLGKRQKVKMIRDFAERNQLEEELQHFLRNRRLLGNRQKMNLLRNVKETRELLSKIMAIRENLSISENEEKRQINNAIEQSSKVASELVRILYGDAGFLVVERDSALFVQQPVIRVERPTYTKRRMRLGGREFY